MDARKVQLRLAQKKFREGKKKQAQCRLEIFISKAGYENLVTASQLIGIPKQEYINELLLKPDSPPTQSLLQLQRLHNELSQMQQKIKAMAENTHRVPLKTNTRYEDYGIEALRALATKQAFWLERLRRVNETLMKRVDELEQV